MSDPGFASGRTLTETWQRRLLQVVDFSLAGVVFIAPLFMGGRHPLGRLVYVAFVCAAAVAWVARQCLERRAAWRWSGAELVLLAGLGLVIFQLMPLPYWLLSKLSPSIPNLLPLWSPSAEPSAALGTWQCISLTPGATQNGLVIYLAHAMLFLVLVQRIRSMEDVHRMLRWIALAAMGMATLGLLQFLLSNGKFLWVYEHPTRNTRFAVKGTFANQNHFAHFLALGIGPVIWWLNRLNSHRVRERSRSDRSSREKRGNALARAVQRTRSAISLPALDDRTLWHLVSIGLGILAFSGLLTFSRGGLVALFVAAAATVGFHVRASLLGNRSLVAIVVFALLIGVAICIYGYEPLTRKLGTLGSVEELSRSRLVLWKAHAAAIPNAPLFGTGVGSHADVYPIYMREHSDVEYSHGENGYLQILVETGVAGLTCVLAGIGLGLTWCARALRIVGEDKPTSDIVACIGAIFGGVLASLVHSLGDFVWYIPACMSLCIVLLACACRVEQLCRSTTLHQTNSESPSATNKPRWNLSPWASEVTWPQWAWACAFLGAIAMGAGMLRVQFPRALAAPNWETYFALAVNSKMLASDDSHTRDLTAKMHMYLERCLGAFPDDDRANLRMAAILLRQFDLNQKTSANPMSLSQIRDAALASSFATRKAQDEWLNIAIGKNREFLDTALVHCQRGLRLAPLQGDGYVYLAELSFLNSPKPAAKQAYVAQAQKVRPHSGIVQFAVGTEAVLTGDINTAMTNWKSAFHQDPEVQEMIIEAFGPQLPADVFLSQFQPDSKDLGRLYYYYRAVNRRDDAAYVGKYFADTLCRLSETTKDSATAANHWHEAQTVYDFLGELTKATACETRAVELAPSDFRKRRTLASLLLRQGRRDEGMEQLTWCQRRRPDDPELSSLLKEAARLRIEPPTLR